MQTVLAKIVADKAIWVEARKQQQPLASFQNEIVPTQRNFYDALAGTRTAFILECKKASPSKGLIREDFDPAAIASIYKHYASAISVLCDEKYFRGSFDFLPIVSRSRRSRSCVRTSPSTLTRSTALLSGRRLPADALGARR